MRILDEGTEEMFVKYNVDIPEEERKLLMEHANLNMPYETLEEFYFNWAVNDLLRKSISEHNSNPKKKESKVSKGQDRRKEKKKPKQEKKK